MPTALTAFLTSTNDSLVSTARQLTNSAPASETNVSTSNISKNCVEQGKPWQELFSQGGSGGTGASEPSPSGQGFLWDVTTLEGQQIIAGNWTPTIKLSMGLSGFTADIYCRAWVRHSNGSYTQIGSDMILTGQTINTGATVYAFSAANFSAANFNTGDKLYIDWLLKFSADPGVVGTTAAQIYENGGANEQVVTPGYQPQGTLSGAGDAYYDWYDTTARAYRPRGLPWHPYYLGDYEQPGFIPQVTVFQAALMPTPPAEMPLRIAARLAGDFARSPNDWILGSGLPPTQIAFDMPPVMPVRPPRPVNAGGTILREFPQEAAPAPLLAWEELGEFTPRHPSRVGRGAPETTIPPSAYTTRVGWGLIPPPTQNAPTVTAGGSLAASTTFFYVITALTQAGETTASNEQSGTTTVTNLTINLSWVAVNGATGYRIYRGTTGGNENVMLAQQAGTTFSDAGTVSLGSQSPPSVNSAGVGTDWGAAHLTWHVPVVTPLFVQARVRDAMHSQQPTIVGGPDPVLFAPVVWDSSAQPRQTLQARPAVAIPEPLPQLGELLGAFVSRLDWLERSTTPMRPQARVSDATPSPALLPKPDAQETLTGAALFPQPATLVRQPLERRDASRAWEQVPIVDAGPLGWFHQPPATGTFQLRPRDWPQGGQDAPFLAALSTPFSFPWIQPEQPTIYPWKMPRPATQQTGWTADVSPVPLHLVAVNGPYFVIASGLFCPGIVIGTVTTE